MSSFFRNEHYYHLTFIPLYLGTFFVNKYVLTVLEFTYPTIFQGWQTLIGAILLRVLYLNGRIAMDFSDVTRIHLLKNIPSMMLFVISIYSGSKALSKTPLPLFLICLNITTVLVHIGLCLSKKKKSSIQNGICIICLFISILECSYNEFETDSYRWMILHVVSTVLLKLTTTYIGDIPLGVVVLAPSCYFLGDALEARNFKFLYLNMFYIGCVLSGVFGVLLNLINIHIQTHVELDWQIDCLDYTSKVLTSSVSLLVFEDKFSTHSLVRFSINFLVMGLYILTSKLTVSTTDNIIEPPSPMKVIQC